MSLFEQRGLDHAGSNSVKMIFKIGVADLQILVCTTQHSCNQSLGFSSAGREHMTLQHSNSIFGCGCMDATMVTVKIPDKHQKYQIHLNGFTGILAWVLGSPPIRLVPRRLVRLKWLSLGREALSAPSVIEHTARLKNQTHRPTSTTQTVNNLTSSQRMVSEPLSALGPAPSPSD